ncbi:hypothetical protein LPJ59_003640 [Coemansia sp. RSA 2399]|nr:hypothetical protein LPJ59_003640 [Coemansia sp. RSA 2399]
MALIDFTDAQPIDNTASPQPRHGQQQEYSRYGLVRRATLDRVSQLSAPGNVYGQRKRFNTLDTPEYSSNLEPIGELGIFDDYLSDASEVNSSGTLETHANHTLESYHNDRRYLNRRIDDVTGWAIGESTVPASPQAFHNTRFGENNSSRNGNESSSDSSKSSARHSWAALGRRLSIQGFPVGNTFYTRPRSSNAGFANGEDSLPHSLQRADGLQPLGVRRRTSWLGSIRKRIKRKDRKNGGEAETMPITHTFFGDNDHRGGGNIVGVHYMDHPFEQHGSAKPATSAGIYPRLRSQPSLCSSARNTEDESSLHNANDAAFVPDTDNLLGIRAHAPSSVQTPPHRWTAKRPQFMLPHRTSTTENAPYKVLRE